MLLRKINDCDISIYIMSGVTIVENAVVGAFRFVNQNIPDGAAAYGVPVKIIKPIPEGD